MNVLLAHGSPDMRHRNQVIHLATRVAEELGEEVTSTFLDEACIPRRARILPLFLGQGRHVMKDAGIIADRYDATLLPPLSKAAGQLADIAVSMAVSMMKARDPTIFVFYRFRLFEQLMAAVYAQRNRLAKMSMASIHGVPDVADLVRFWETEGVDRLVIQPMLLFSGHSLGVLQAQANSHLVDIIWGETLCSHAEMPRLVADCFRSVA